MQQKNQPSIQLKNLSKSYAEKVIFQQLNYRWQGNGIFVLSGANGAGKSTLLQIIVGMDTVYQGQVLIHDQVCSQKQLAEHMSFVPDAMVAYPFLTGQDFLEFIASLRNISMSKAQVLIDAFQLQDFLQTRFDAMSFGTAKKMMLISAFMSDTSILVLDEPTHGLDVQSLNVLKELLLEAAQHRLILMTCHDVHLQQMLNAQHVNLYDLVEVA